MKIGVITDIHSNLPALNAVLTALNNDKVDYIINCGDIVGNGAYPEETVQRVKKLNNFISVKGNHDIFANIDLTSFNSLDTRVKFFKWQQKVLSGYSKRYLDSLPLTFTETFDGVKVTAVHYPLNRFQRFKDLIYMPNEKQTTALFADIQGDVILFGHEHSGSLQTINGKTYLNFGTLGNFLEKGFTRYGILNISGGKCDYELKRIPYCEDNALYELNKIRNILGMDDAKTDYVK